MASDAPAVDNQPTLPPSLTPRHSLLSVTGYASLWGVADLAGDVVVPGDRKSVV